MLNLNNVDLINWLGDSYIRFYRYVLTESYGGLGCPEKYEHDFVEIFSINYARPAIAQRRYKEFMNTNNFVNLDKECEYKGV
jgi:hypothetical protein